MKFYSGLFLALFVTFIFIPACKKDILTSNALLVLDIHSIFSGDSVVLGTTYKSSLGRNFSLSRINYYISDITLTSTDNSVQSISGTLLINPKTEQYVAGAVPPGSYKSISFVVGIDSTANYIDPSTYDTGALAAQNPSMHFSSDSLGYIFLAVEGLFDSSASGTGTPNTVFSYHVGTSSLLEGVNMPDHSVAPYNAVFTAAKGQLLTVHLEANLSVLLNNIDLKNNPITNTTDYPVLADTLASHIPGMFVYQQ